MGSRNWRESTDSGSGLPEIGRRLAMGRQRSDADESQKVRGDRLAGRHVHDRAVDGDGPLNTAIMEDALG